MLRVLRFLVWALIWFVGLSFALVLISLTGLPPTAGFVSKWYLILAALEQGAWWLAVVLPWLMHRQGADPAFGSGPLAMSPAEIVTSAPTSVASAATWARRFSNG